MTTAKCTLVLQSENDNRAVAILRYPNKKHVNAAEVFESLDRVSRRSLRRRFDRWANGAVGGNHFHGWPKSHKKGKYNNCFVFRADEHRLYGFLCHPKTDLSFQLCVLVTHEEKHQELTNETTLNRILEIALDPNVISVIQRAYGA